MIFWLVNHLDCVKIQMIDGNSTSVSDSAIALNDWNDPYLAMVGSIVLVTFSSADNVQIPKTTKLDLVV